MRCFGEFLAARGLVTQAQLDDALSRQLDTIIPLGTLAVEEHLLTPGQVDEIQDTQRHVDRRLGEIALDRQWLTARQLEELLAAQSGRHLLLGELLVEAGALDRGEMESALGDFESLQSSHTRQLEALLRSLPAAEVIRSLLDLTAKHYHRTTTEPVKISSVTFERLFSPYLDGAPRHFFAQRASGDRDLVYGLVLDEQRILQIASSMLHRPCATLDALALDSLCEFVNMVVGNSFGKLAEDGIRLHPEPPTFCPLEEALATLSGCTRVEMVSRRGSLDAVISFDPGDGVKGPRQGEP